MQLLDEHLWSLFHRGLIADEEAVDKSRHPGQMQDKIDAYKRGQDISGLDEKKGEGDEPDVPRLNS
jgi:hypothetical protein